MLFKYKAIKYGKLVNNQIQAENQEAVLRFLRTSDYFPVEVRRLDYPQASFLRYFINKIGFGDIVDLTRQLAIMLGAGLTLIDALDILKKQTSKPALHNLLESLDKEIRGGSNFSSALALYPQHFSSLYISLIRSGEASGKLTDILLKLSDNLEKQRNFRGKLRGALIYPSIIIIAMVVVGFIMITFVVPKLLDLYKDFNTELPLITKILIALSGFMTKYWPFVIAVFILGFLLFKKYLNSSPGKFLRDKTVLRIPVIGNVIQMSALVDSTRTLSILITSGVSLLEGLSIIVEATSNVIYKDAFETVKKQVEKGSSLGNAMKQAEIFPPILVQMTLVGEQTGHLDETLGRVSKYFETESELAIKAMTTLIEPTVLIILGLGVAALVFAIISPIYNLTTSIK